LRRSLPIRRLSLVLASLALPLLVAAALPRPASPVATGGGTFYVAPYGSDSNACTRSSPCASLDAAYRASKPGDLVEVAAGRYEDQTIRPDPSKRSTKHVDFRPAAGAVVTLGCNSVGSDCLNVQASHVTLRGLHTASLGRIGDYLSQGGVSVDRPAVDVRLVNIDAGSLWIAGQRVTVLGGDFGPSVDQNTKISDSGLRGQDFPPSDILIDHARFHDYHRFERHMECISIDGGDRLTIRDSSFDTCAVFAIFATPEPGAHIRDITIENNVFSNRGHEGMANMIKVSTHGGTCRNFVIRNNTIVDDDIYDECGNPVVVEGNIIGANQATCGPAWDYNVFERARPCGKHATVVRDVRYVDRARGNYHLRRDSPAIDRVDARVYARRDMDGQRRPVGRAADAGADEVSAAR
jgi:Right handed beta helix region